MFFFVMFSVDGNMAALNAAGALTESQRLYMNALNSNTSLAYTFLSATAGLTAFVYVMYFYRFFREYRTQIGCLKSLGFKDRQICLGLVIFVAGLSAIGLLIGLLAGYFLADILIEGNKHTYLVTRLVKGAGPVSLMMGLAAPALVFCLTSVCCYGTVRGKEPGVLIAGNLTESKYSPVLRIADAVSKLIPVKDKFPYRIAFRKPLAVLLIAAAVMTLSTFVILGRSLNISNRKILESQTDMHGYLFDTKFEGYKTGAALESNNAAYIESAARIYAGGHELERTVVGLYAINGMFRLRINKPEGNGGIPKLEDYADVPPEEGTVFINPELAEIYGVKRGDTLQMEIAGERRAFTVTETAYNAKIGAVYLNAGELTQILRAPSGAYNGVMGQTELPGGTSVSIYDSFGAIERSLTSNDISAHG